MVKYKTKAPRYFFFFINIIYKYYFYLPKSMIFKILNYYLLAKMADMQQELKELRRQLKEVNVEKETFEGKYNEAVESMEMMTLDKEMAEEKAENLQHEVNLLKEKIEEISVDLSVFKQEGGKLTVSRLSNFFFY